MQAMTSWIAGEEVHKEPEQAHQSAVIHQRPMRVFLIDDDSIFNQLMSRYAQALNIDLTVANHIFDLEELMNGSFDVAIVDFNLGSTNGIDLAHYFSYYIGDFPVLLVSQTDRSENLKRLRSLSTKAFVHKLNGPKKILSEASQLRQSWLKHLAHSLK